MRLVDIRYLAIFVLSILSLPALAAHNSEYGDIIKDTPEYEKIIKPKVDDDNDNGHHHHYPYPYPYPRPVYRPPTAYYQPSDSHSAGLPGAIYLGVTIGNSEFDYDDIEDGDSSIFRFGYRPRDGRLGYELSFYDSGKSAVTSLSDIDIQVDTLNLVLTVNSSTDTRSRLNLFGQGGIYFANTRLIGPFDSVSEKSNGFLLAVGADIKLNRSFSLRIEAYELFDVEDFANDESISIVNLGGQFVF